MVDKKRETSWPRALGPAAVLLSGLIGFLLATTDRSLRVPVQGVHPRGLVSTYGAPRSGGRRHAGVDIFAPKGTPIRAAGWGWVIAKTTLSLGGKVLFTFGEDGTVCYYAHLDQWAPGLEVGDFVDRNTVVGTVGQTGNARTTPPHLHFSTRPWWRAFRHVDPVTLLREPAYAKLRAYRYRLRRTGLAWIGSSGQ